MRLETNDRRQNGAGNGADPRSSDAGRRGEDVRDESLDALVRTIEAEVIPRLMLAHQAKRGTAGPPALDAGAVDGLVEIVLHHEVEVALDHVEGLRRRGVEIESLLLDLLAPAARQLGEDWLSDRSTFADVTIALTRLHRVLRVLVDEVDEALVPHETDRAALLLPVGREQHTFGLAVVEAFFRRSGWSVLSGAHEAEAPRLVRGAWFDVVGFGVSCDAHLETLAATIRTVRRASRNPHVRVLVGGPLLVERPELAERLGADATARDGRAACETAERLVAKPSA